MNGSCNLKVDISKSTTLQKVKEFCGTNATKFQEFFNSVVERQNPDGTVIFRGAFKNWYINTYNEEPNANPSDGRSARAIANRIAKYLNKIRPSVVATARSSAAAAVIVNYGYSSMSARNFAKRFTANVMLDFYRQDEYNLKRTKPEVYEQIQTDKAKLIARSRLSTLNDAEKQTALEEINNAKNVKEVKTILSQHNLDSKLNLSNANKQYYFNEVRKRIKRLVVDRIIETDPSLQKQVKSGDKESRKAARKAAIEKLKNKDHAITALGGKNIAYQNANLLALYYEVLTNPLAFLDEVSLDSRLGDFRYNSVVEFNDFNDIMAVAAQSKLDDSNYEELDTNENPTDSDTDVTVMMYDHSGMFTSALMHVGFNIRSYFNSLKKLNSSNTIGDQPDYDLNNDLGVPDTMDANLCCTVMYHYGNYANVDAMIESVTTIANTISGMTAFHTFAEDLKQNRDFAYEVYSVFGKTVIGKVETVFDGTTVSTKLRNKYSNRVEAFSQELLNSITHTSINNDFEEEQENLKEIETQLGTSIILNKILEDKNSPYRKKYVQKIYEALHKYYPTINEYSIENYINSNKQGDGSIDVSKNISTLVGILRDTINASKETQQEWRRIQDEGRKAYGYNKNLDKQEKEAKEAGERIIPKERKNVQEIYAQSHLTTKQKEQAILLSKELAPYSLIAVEINSVNVEGKQSSDVVNNSFLTYMKHVLEDDATSQNFGDYKFQSSQYNYSTILLEERDENGVITKLGLFKKQTDGGVRPTPYAKSLLQINMFDGGRNSETGENVLYSKMPEVDYIGTAFANFFNTSDYVEKTPVCEYFMRIPSDAPRNFTIRAPKLSAEGLFKIENETEIESLIRDRFKLIPTIKETNGSVNFSTVNNKSFITVNDENTYIEHLTAEPNTIHLRLPRQYADKFKDGQRVQLKLRYINAEGDNNLDQYILDGVVSDGKLINANLVGIKDANNISKTIEDKLRKKFRKQLEADGQIKRTINKEHPIFKQFKNIFKQELLDAGVALDFLFNLYDDGLVNRKKDIYKPNTSKIGSETVGAFENYHYKGKNIIEVDETTGRERLTGNVFHSDRFVMYDENAESSRNFGEEILEEAFDFLYGGATNKYLHVVRDASGKVVDVTLTPKQEEIIDNKLTEFINEYVTRDLKRLENVENVLHGTELNFETAAEFSLNYHLAYVGFGELFEGDTKFYKSPQDFLKRAKEAQGSGIPYGITDYTHILVDKTGQPEKQDILDAPLSNKEFAGGYKITQRTGFTGVTVINTVQTNKEALGILEKHLTTKCGLTDKEAHDLLYGEDGTRGYQGTKVNDAQSYITFDEWVRRVAARGQLEKYTPLINKVLSGEDLTVEDITEFIQVQKNFYYDQHYNSQSGICAPRQIKNAEFVLVPQLIKGTELEYVEKLMKKHGIDQLNTAETSKAGKTNILEIFDGKTGRVKKDIIKEIDTDEQGKASKLSKFSTKVKAAKETFSYNFLYTQQETPQHMNAENKAGIQIMKKIVDNIPDDHPLAKVKDDFFKLYQANIKGSFDDLMNELNIELDNNGNILTTTDAQGNTIISGINYDMLYEKFRNECARLGLDSNMLDYVTLDDNRMLQNSNNTIMPNYMNRVSQKLENIAQALFNSSITRQKLPGFHAAQITSVGFNKLSNTVSSVGYSDKLGYHENKNGVNAEKQKGKYVDYIEIMLPASAFGFKRYDENGRLKTDEELLAELREAKLDEIIGYRIPTEGKQSVCKMKVVGFVSDVYGSTIVVPNDWVTQTGSGFEIDSIYGIQFHTYIDKNGKIQKVQYKEKNEFDICDWYRYIEQKTGKRIEGITDEKFEKALKQASAIAKKNKKDTISTYIAIEKDNRSNLPIELVKEIYKINKDIYDVDNIDESPKDRYNRFIEKYKSIRELIQNYISENSNIQNFDKIQAYLDNLNALINLSEQSNSDIFNKELEEIFNFLRYEQEVGYNRLAEKYNLLSKDEYIEQANTNPVKFNSRAARNNKILECMTKILQDNESLVENLSRSNFDDIIAARDELLKSNKHISNSRAARTSYNILDQASFHTDAISGLKLKGISVSRDSFCSICNTVKPTISEDYGIKVTYSEDIIDYKTAVERFGEINVDRNNDGTITIKHNKFGWSNDNKNVVGKILTSYSSQTTAHILDAIKEGNIPNVNDLTFNVYKLFPDLGIDYNTAIAFMMQSGISRIVDSYEKNKSIYVQGQGNPVKGALLSIAQELNLPVNVYDNINTIVLALDKRLNTKFAKTLYKGLTQYPPLNSDILIKELNNNNKDDKKYIREITTILQYRALSNLANNITNIALTCRSDKFGAKQSIFATEEIIEKINDILAKDYLRKRFGKNPILSVNGTPFLASVYPDIDLGVEGFIKSKDKQSSYPPLYTFLKYSTCSSILINRTLFITQTPNFKRKINELSVYLGKLDEKTYKDYEKYIITTFYNKCNCLLRPITYTIGDNSTFISLAEENENEGNKKEIFKKEKRRILGYSGNSNLDFEVKDISNPTQEEINEFAELTPAEKVTWIKDNFYDSGVFNYLKTNLHNDIPRGRNLGKQTITFIDTSVDIENIYIEFNQAFNNENPFVALAAYDLIKYAFIAEGYKMKRNDISKIIPNNVLYNDFGNTGIGLITELQGHINNILRPNYNSQDVEINSAINYIRTKRNLPQIPKRNVAKIRGKAFELSRRNGVICVNSESELALKYNIVSPSNDKRVPRNIANHLVYLTFDGDTILYKINFDGNHTCYLYPLTYLEENEVGEFSANDANNKYSNNLNEDYYIALIEDYKERLLNTSTEAVIDGFNDTIFNESVNSINKEDYKYEPQQNTNFKYNPIDFDLDNPLPEEQGMVDHLLKDINDNFGNGKDSSMAIHWNPALKKHIRKSGYNYRLTKNFIIKNQDGNDEIISLEIVRMSNKDINKRIIPYLDNPTMEIKRSDKIYEDIITKLRNNNIKTLPSRELYKLIPSIVQIDEVVDDYEAVIYDTGVENDEYINPNEVELEDDGLR